MRSMEDGTNPPEIDAAARAPSLCHRCSESQEQGLDLGPSDRGRRRIPEHKAESSPLPSVQYMILYLDTIGPSEPRLSH
jgi:hypothetical protein